MPSCFTFLQDLLLSSFHSVVPCVCVCLCVCVCARAVGEGREGEERLTKAFVFNLLEIFSHFFFTLSLIPLFFKRKMEVYGVFVLSACVSANNLLHLFNSLITSHKASYKLCSSRRHFSPILANFLKYVMTTWRR